MASVSSAKKRAEQLVEEVMPLVKEIAAEGAAAVEAAEKEAYSNLSRLSRVQEERESLRLRSEAIRRELSAAPAKLAQATLDERWAEEDEIRASYKNLKVEREGLEQRRRELAEEARELMGPNASRKGHVPHPSEAEIFQRRRITKALTEAMAPLHALSKLSTAITNELHGFQGEALTHRGRDEALSTQRLSDTQRAKAGVKA